MSATTILLFLLVLNTELLRGAFADHALPQVPFSLCSEGYILNGASMATLNSRSLPDCADVCLKSQDCGSFNFCPEDSLASPMCHLLADRDNQSCGELSLVSATSCRHGYQTSSFRLVPTQSSGTVVSWTAGHISDVTNTLTTIILTTPDETDTTQLVAEQATTDHSSTSERGPYCLNGGTLSGIGVCNCTVQWAGEHCQRYIRDCTEAYDNGHTNNALNGVYWIQPVGAPNAFQVMCDLQWGGVTYPFRRSTISFNRDYNACVAGFGDDVTNNGGDPENHFVGLENLHHLLSQATYENNVFMSWDNSAEDGQILFNNFTVGPASSFFALNFNSADVSKANGAEAGFESGMKFSAAGREVGNCATSTEAPGWYDDVCGGPRGLFGGDYPEWKINGNMVTINWLDWNIARTSDYY